MASITDCVQLIDMEFSSRGRCIECCKPATPEEPQLKIIKEVKIRHEVTWEVLAVGRELRQRCYIACP